MDAALAAGSILTPRARRVADEIGLLCKIMDEPFTIPKDELFAEFWFRTGKSRQEPRVTHTAGILQFSLYPFDASDLPRAYTIADKLKDAFGEKAWRNGATASVTTDPMGVRTLKRYKFRQRWVLVVDGGFDLYRRP